MGAMDSQDAQTDPDALLTPTPSPPGERRIHQQIIVRVARVQSNVASVDTRLYAAML